MMSTPRRESRSGSRACPRNDLPAVALAGLLFVVLAVAPGCAPVFSELQSAKLVGKGRVEVTPSLSTVSFSNEGESDEVQTHMGLQMATGLSEDTDLRVRYERISVDTGSDDASIFHILGFGPKVGLVEDRSALYLPVGFAFGDNVDESSKTWQFHPTFLFTVPLGNGAEFNPSCKALIPLTGDGGDVLLALNLGAGLSSDLEKWVIRPEIGFLFNPDGDAEGHYMHYSIGLTLYP